MNQVMTLIAPPGKLDEPLAMAVARAIPSLGGKVLGTRWLSEGEACDVRFEHSDPKIVLENTCKTIGTAPVDAILQPEATRRKRLLITDMDSTVITCECIDELADFVGLKAHVAAITERAMNGELDFAEALTERVALLKGLNEATLAQAYAERVEFMPGARTLVQTMKAHGAHAVLVSGGFTYFTTRVAAALGFDEDHANTLEIAGGALTGRVVPPILGKEAKLATLNATCARLGLTPEDALAVGDGANDLPMLLAAGLGVAYHAKPSVQQAARAKLNHTDLSALLFAQGYAREEWVSA